MDGQCCSFYFSETDQVRSVEAALVAFRNVDALNDEGYRKTLNEFSEKYELAAKDIEGSLGRGK